MHVFPATANDCILQTNSFGLVNRHIFRPTDKNGTACLPYQPSVPVLWRTNYKIGDSLFKCHYLKVLIDLEGTKVGSLSSYINVKI